MSSGHVIRHAPEAEKSASPAWAGSASGFRRWAAVGEAEGVVHTGFGTCSSTRGGDLPGHLHSFEESFYVVEGTGVLDTPEGALRVTAGDYGMLPVGVPHRWRNHLGDVGAGATMKLVVNAMVHALNVSLSEAFVLALKAGLDRERVYDVLEASAVGAPFVHYKRTAFVDPAGAPVAFSLDLVAKDLRLISGLAADVGARMDQSDTNHRLVAEAVTAGLGERDMSALAQYLR